MIFEAVPFPLKKSTPFKAMVLLSKILPSFFWLYYKNLLLNYGFPELLASDTLSCF